MDPKNLLRAVLEHVGEPLGALEAPSPKNNEFWDRPGGPNGSPNPLTINLYIFFSNNCFQIIFKGFGSVSGAKMGPK